MRERFDSEYIRSELTRAGEQLDASVTAYLIGGGSMAFRDLKETTKDIDLVVTDGATLHQLQTVLLDCGYEIVEEPDEEYDELGALRILENDDGCRIDVFNRQVVDKLVLSDEMRGRSERRLAAGALTVELVSTEDIFLFKSVAGRTDDIDDMNRLVQTGLDFDIVETELTHQIDLLGQELFVSYVNEALVALADRHNVTTPIESTVGKITERVYRELEVLQSFDESTSMSELRDLLDLSSTEIDGAVRSLERKDVVTVDDGRLVKQSSTL